MAATRGTQQAGLALQAAVNWFGPIAFGTMDAQFDALGLRPMLGPTNDVDSPESRYLGVPVGAADATLLAAASPESYISANTPPMLIQHGTRDRNIPVTQSVDFATALSRELGEDRVELTILDGAGHGGEAFESDHNLALVFAFFAQAYELAVSQ